jgi:hypothetical protein
MEGTAKRTKGFAQLLEPWEQGKKADNKSIFSNQVYMRSFRISVQLEELILNECFASRSVMSMSPTNCLAGRKCGRYRGMSGRRQSEPKERH